MPEIVPALRSALLTPIRNGDRTVLWAQPDLGFANLLYLWLVAAARQARGDDVVVRYQPVMDAWLPVLPRLAELTVDSSAVRFRDRRDLGFHQAFGADFTREELEAFVHGYLLDTPLLSEVSRDGDPGLLTVNVRRGDYYSVARFRGMYSFDVAEYLRTAVAESVDRRRAGRPPARRERRPRPGAGSSCRFLAEHARPRRAHSRGASRTSTSGRWRRRDG